MKKNNPIIAPVVKWVGGKRQLLNTYARLLPQNIFSYCEPFVGGGAVFFNIQPKVAYINDINEDLISLYEVIRDDVDALIHVLEQHPNTSEHFYEVRNWDRNPLWGNAISKVERAARIIYLNKTCFNGLFRVNSAGEFNTPFGSYKNPNIVNASGLRAVNRYFKEAQITFTSGDYATVLKNVKKDTFVYLDPPYDPVSSTANFTGYVRGGFGREDQIRLRDCCNELHRRGVKFMLSNSATEFIKEIYGQYDIQVVQAKRALNAVGSKRGDVNELVIRNYE